MSCHASRKGSLSKGAPTAELAHAKLDQQRVKHLTEAIAELQDDEKGGVYWKGAEKCESGVWDVGARCLDEAGAPRCCTYCSDVLRYDLLTSNLEDDKRIGTIDQAIQVIAKFFYENKPRQGKTINTAILNSFTFLNVIICT